MGEFYEGHSISDPTKIPKVKHWVILEPVSVNIPGDERSRTNPGHGYPEHTERFLSYRVFLNEEKWKSVIRELESGSYKKVYVAAQVNPAEIKTSVTVTCEVNT